MGTICHAFTKYILHILLKSHTQNYHPTSLRNRIWGGGLGGLPNNFKLPQNWIICIENMVY